MKPRKLSVRFSIGPNDDDGNGGQESKATEA